MRKKYLYHCSHINHGSELVVRRQFPRLMADGEPKTPRLCVSPTVPQCLSARLFLSSIWVYRTPKPCRGVTPSGVWDSVLTDERWLLPGHKLELVEVIPKSRVKPAFSDIADWHCRNKKGANLEMRVATLWVACVSFPEHTSRRLMRLSESLCEKLEIDPIEIFSG